MVWVGSIGRGEGTAVPFEGVEVAAGAEAACAGVVAVRVARGSAIAQPIEVEVADRVVVAAESEVGPVPLLVDVVLGEMVAAEAEDAASSCWNRAAWSGASTAALAR